jgi:hypothetical protein
MAHTPFVLAQKAPADRPEDHSDCCMDNWIEGVVEVRLLRLAKVDWALRVVDVEEVSLELVGVLGAHQSEPAVLAAVVLVEEQLEVRLVSVGVVELESRHPLDHYRRLHRR